MPEISRFYGIIIRMYFDDHPPPHFHAFYGEHVAVIDINAASALSGSLPPRAMGLVTEWTLIHQEELRDLWQRAENMQSIGKIDPLP
jgi:hypothetical protein